MGLGVRQNFRDCRLPIRPSSPTNLRRTPWIVISPRIAFGRPVLLRRGISTSAIAEQIDAGETIKTSCRRLRPQLYRKYKPRLRCTSERLEPCLLHRPPYSVSGFPNLQSPRSQCRTTRGQLCAEHAGRSMAGECGFARLGFAITHDRRIRYKPNERDAVMRQGVALLVVVGAAPVSDLGPRFRGDRSAY